MWYKYTVCFLTTATRTEHAAAASCTPYFSACAYAYDILSNNLCIRVYIGEVALCHSNGNDCESAAVLVSKSSAQDEGAMNNTYANADGVAPGFYEVPVSGDQSQQYEAVVEHATFVKADAAAQGFYEVPVSGDQSQYDTVLKHTTGRPVTENPNVVYEGVGSGASSAASSLFYQYVPSKVSTLL